MKSALLWKYYFLIVISLNYIIISICGTDVGRNESKILIHADFRSGSTFASDFFSQNKNFFYIYEPFNLIEFQYIYPNLVEILRDLFNCKFQKLWDMSYTNPKYKLKPSGRDAWKHKMFCWKDFQDKLCRYRSIKDFEKECLLYPNRVIKSIRVEELSHLMPLMKEDIKVLQLIRDPRGLTSSRLGLSRNKYRIMGESSYSRIRMESYFYCLRKNKDFAYADFSLKTGIPYFGDNYLLIRYEDLSTQPMKALKQIYNKFHIKPDQAVMSWVKVLEQRIHDVSLKDKTKIKEVKIFTDRVNSTETAFDWRKKMPFEFVDYIQIYCNSFLENTGYNFLRSSIELKDFKISAMKTYEYY